MYGMSASIDPVEECILPCNISGKRKALIMCIRLFVFMITLNSLLHVTWLSFFFIEELSVGSACEPQRKLYAIESESQRFEVKKKKSFYDGKSSEL